MRLKGVKARVHYALEMCSVQILTLKMKVNDVDLDEIRTYLVNMHIEAKIGAFRSSRLFALHSKCRRVQTVRGEVNMHMYVRL